MAVIAVFAGVRAGICKMPLPSPMRDVRPAMNDSSVTASAP